MSIVLTLLVIIFLFLFSNTAGAAPYGTKVCGNDDRFTCYTVKRNETWTNLFDDSEQRDLVMRINRMNTRLHRGMKIAIPNDLDTASPLDYAPFNHHIDAPGKRIIIVSLSRLAFAAYDEDGNLQYWGPVSGGKGYCSDIGRGCHSPTGQFAIYSKGGPSCVSTKFPVGRGGAPMPYCMYFHGGFALHGSYEVPGYNASHGCVRMFVNDAEWLNREFTEGEYKTPVIIMN